MEHAICFNCGEPLFGMADADLCWDCAEPLPEYIDPEALEQALGNIERAEALERRAQFNRPW